MPESMTLGIGESQGWIHKLAGRSKEEKAGLSPDQSIQVGMTTISLSLTTSCLDPVPIPGQRKGGVNAGLRAWELTSGSGARWHLKFQAKVQGLPDYLAYQTKLLLITDRYLLNSLSTHCT